MSRLPACLGALVLWLSPAAAFAGKAVPEREAPPAADAAKAETAKPEKKTAKKGKRAADRVKVIDVGKAKSGK